MMAVGSRRAGKRNETPEELPERAPEDLPDRKAENMSEYVP